MIKMETSNGETEMVARGSGPELFADFTCFASAFIEAVVGNGILPRDAAVKMLGDLLSHAFGYAHE